MIWDSISRHNGHAGNGAGFKLGRFNVHSEVPSRGLTTHIDPRNTQLLWNL